ncbi:transcriptional regulator [Kalymmatonema gypsitolerans NIES-4073]|nr:transcriptional regulator [Scytonema sp. NIES-4073]
MAATKKPKSRSATREALLRAASQVVINKGVEALTLDAVAQQAGVSKGGLLYHFPNKDALMGGMVEQLIQDFEREAEVLSSRERGRSILHAS